MQPPTPSSPDVVATPAPAAPAQPDAPPAPPAARGRATVTLPDGPLPLDGLPKNAQELRGLRERRDILRDQLERATNRRGQLLGQIENADRQGPEARVGVQQRLDLLDARILQLERDQMLTERLISNAPPGVIAAASAEEPRDRGPQVDEDEAIGGAFAAFGFGVVLTLVISRLRRRFARRRAGVLGKTAAPTDDPRIDRLAQAVDAIAEEVERIGEGQRFVTQILAQRPAEAPAALRVGEAERR
jgi:hypothetical protein